MRQYSDDREVHWFDLVYPGWYNKPFKTRIAIYKYEWSIAEVLDYGYYV